MTTEGKDETEDSSERNEDGNTHMENDQDNT